MANAVVRYASFLGCVAVVAAAGCSSSSRAPAGGGDGSTGGAATDGGASGPGAGGAPSGGSDTGTSPGTSGGTGTSGSSGTPDAAGGDTVPSSIAITGKLSTSCTQPSGRAELDCELLVTDLASTPAPPAGTALPDILRIAAENLSSPDGGWDSGLQVTAPAYPAACSQALSWGNRSSGVKLNYIVFPHTEGGSPCGLATATDADFAGGFKAAFKARWGAPHTLVDATLTLTP
jgi:hypothetical protein